MAQFTCNICEDGFKQKSRLQRHIDTSHPPQAPSAADLQKVLAAIDYLKTKDDLVQYSSQKMSTIDKEILFDLIKSLPSCIYRDSAEVAIAPGELKSGNKLRVAKEIEVTASTIDEKGNCIPECILSYPDTERIEGEEVLSWLSANFF